MVNEAILGALKSALVRGESLKKAMMTVYNAGYKREEISEAARLINEGSSSQQVQPIQQVNAKQPQQVATTQMLASSKKPSSKEKKSKKSTKQTPPEMPQQPQTLQQVQLSTQQPQVAPQQVQQPVQQLPVTQQQVQQSPTGQNIVQKVSGYGQPPTKKSKTTIIILGFLLLFLIGILVTIFLFKEELLNFFNNLFS